MGKGLRATLSRGTAMAGLAALAAACSSPSLALPAEVVAVHLATSTVQAAPIVESEDEIDNVTLATSTVQAAPLDPIAAPEPATEPEAFLPDDLEYALSHYKLYADELEILNSAHPQESIYGSAFDAIPDSLMVWPFLRSRETRINFVRLMLEGDDLDKHPYVTKDWGPDADGDGITEVRTICDESGGCMTYDEAGTVIERVESFVCHDFAVELVRRFRETVPKHRIPFSYVAFSWEQFIGHAVDAVMVEEAIADVDSYYFIEPQNDSDIGASGPLIDIYEITAFGTPLRNDEELALVQSFLRTPEGEYLNITGETRDIIHEFEEYLNGTYARYEDGSYGEQAYRDFSAYDARLFSGTIGLLMNYGFLSPEQIDEALSLAKSLPQGFNQ